MKKILAAVLALFIAGSAYSLDLGLGFHANMGADNTSGEGTSVGGGAYLNLDLAAGLGLQFQVDVLSGKFYTEGNDLVYYKNPVSFLPVMIWYNADIGPLVVGGGAGLSLAFYDKECKCTLAAGGNAKLYFGDSFAFVVGVTGILDCFPTWKEKDDGDSKRFHFEKTNWLFNTVYASVGFEIKFGI